MADARTIEQLFEANDVAALEEIAAHAPKAEAKEARRALHRLASRGVAVPEARPAGDRVFKPAQAEFPAECFLSAFDAEGGRVAFVFRRNPAGGVLGTIMFMDEEKGIIAAQESVLGRKEYRAWVDGLLNGERKIVAHRADPDEVKRALRDARARTEAEKRILPPEAAALPPEWYAPVNDRREEPAADLSLAAESMQLFAEPEVASWIPPQEFLQALVLKVQEAETSHVLVDEAQKVGRVREILLDAVDGYFTAGVRRAYARRLRGTAAIFEDTGRAAQAATARAAAAWLEDEKANLGGLGFARAFILRVFGAPPLETDDPTLEHAPDHVPPAEESAPRLIVTPGEYAQELAKKKP